MLETWSYDDYYQNKAVDGPRIAIYLAGAMGAVGLVLAIAGLYGFVAYNVSRGTREIGIRMALGAKQSDVLRLMLGKALVVIGIGTATGMLMGFAVERPMDSMLFKALGPRRKAGLITVCCWLLLVPFL
ncbi:MAG TPA: FtsX-like permease family protein [Blastocatellia bacterium]|nr:FtsX-like permease family protein [Blastocatellia bacterium]